MKIKALIVDDEPLARERIRTLLAKEPDIEVVGECANGDEALAAMKKQPVDLLFLDVQMPEMDGFELLSRLGKDALPAVIFVTAYDQHAVRAFEIHALDYLLKPFKQSRFKEAVQRVRGQIGRRQTDEVSQRLLQLLSERKPAAVYLNRLTVRENDRVLLVKASQIEWIESAGNYVVLHVGKQNHILRETLAALEAQLDPKLFLRVSRSALVNLDQVRELQPLFKGEYVVVLLNGQQLPMTRGIRELEEKLRFS
ncbi:MAG: LytTR family DNA-binding domain-containing protein [Verrucomicrobia bacterium]|nr:LytTR family DNA-binding domain-containing protein [Verrucomicrobiota bacterium]